MLERMEISYNEVQGREIPSTEIMSGWVYLGIIKIRQSYADKLRRYANSTM